MAGPRGGVVEGAGEGAERPSGALDRRAQASREPERGARKRALRTSPGPQTFVDRGAWLAPNSWEG